jgi:hypothetical protein
MMFGGISFESESASVENFRASLREDDELIGQSRILRGFCDDWESLGDLG